jgi:hypothetical protein
MTILSDVPNLFAVVARVPHWSERLWWPVYHLLLRRRSVGKLLLLLLLELWAIALELWRSAWLSRGWRVNHTVLQESTAGTAFEGSWHSPLPLLLLGCFTSLHSALLIYGSTG